MTTPPIARRSTPALAPSMGIDTVVQIDNVQAEKFSVNAEYVEFACAYIRQGLSQEIDACLQNGLAVIPVTYGGWMTTRDIDAYVSRAATENVPMGTTLYLDLESREESAQVLIALINHWALMCRDHGYDPGLYVGPGCILTSDELYQTKVDRYWKGGSRILDRNGMLAEPQCGWCMVQLYPGNVMFEGVEVDHDVIQQDFRGRVPSWIVKA